MSKPPFPGGDYRGRNRSDDDPLPPLEWEEIVCNLVLPAALALTALAYVLVLLY